MKQEKIYTQHSENNEWMNNVAFYCDEIKIMENRLREVASKNTSKEVLKEVEHFQNQFIIQKERLGDLKHKINLSNVALSNTIKENPVALEHRKVKDHSAAREDMQLFEKHYAPLKNEFNAFLSKWM
jgi:hypothetical protein